MGLVFSTYLQSLVSTKTPGTNTYSEKIELSSISLLMTHIQLITYTRVHQFIHLHWGVLILSIKFNFDFRCWLPITNGVIYAFVGPVILVFVVSIHFVIRFIVSQKKYAKSYSKSAIFLLKIQNLELGAISLNRRFTMPGIYGICKVNTLSCWLSVTCLM